MRPINNITNISSKEEVIEELCKLFSPYAEELLNSGGEFNYMNMFADNFKEPLLKQTLFDEFEIFEILNTACDISWKRQMG